jgi:hypothetical protein
MRPEDEVNEIQDEARELANYIKKSLGAYKSNPPDRDKSEVGVEPLCIALLSIAVTVAESKMGTNEGRQYIIYLVQDMCAEGGLH